jgi:hypothetical protein
MQQQIIIIANAVKAAEFRQARNLQSLRRLSEGGISSICCSNLAPRRQFQKTFFSAKHQTPKTKIGRIKHIFELVTFLNPTFANQKVHRGQI